MTTETETFYGNSIGTLEMSLEDAESVSHSGQCDDDVLALSKRSDIASQLDAIDPEDLRKELREYGAWDDEELSDHDQNLQRILWLAGGNIVDEVFERKNRVTCDQCEALMINGVFCHESGCPNQTHECKECDAQIPHGYTLCESCANPEPFDETEE
jgi:hypothetical protein